MDEDLYHHHDDYAIRGGNVTVVPTHQDSYRKRSSTTSQPRHMGIKRQKEMMCQSYRTTIKDDVHDLSHVDQAMEIETLPEHATTTPNNTIVHSIPLHQRSTNHGDYIYQQIVHQFSIGSGSLLLDDQHLLDPTTMEDVLNASVQDQGEWLEMVIYARQRAKAWDATQYMKERNALKSWLR